MENVDENKTKYLTVNPFELGSFSLEKHLYMMEFDVERWYSSIEQFTFRTKFFNLEKDEARGIIEYYRWYMDPSKAGLLPNANKHIESLYTKIQEALVDFPNGAFVRLSSRSPKDAPMNKTFTKMRNLIQEETSKMNTSDFFGLPPNDKLRVLFNAIGRGLISKDFRDALSLLTKSERVFSDLLHALDHEEHWNMKVVIREWFNLDPAMEFRSFVVNRKLTAVAQYNDLLYYPELQGKQEILAKQIKEYFTVVEPHIKYDNYVIDFVLLPSNELKVVEINPFGPVTGAPLFDYKIERYLLQGGVDVWGDMKETSLPSTCTEKEKEMINNGLPVFRILEAPSPNVTDEYIEVLFSDLMILLKKAASRGDCVIS